MATTDILGISAFYHDSAACLLRDGEIIAAAQEERFTRRKGDAAFPARAVEFCLRTGGVTSARPAYVGVYVLHRVQGEFRRVQGHGPCPVRQAAIRGPDLSRAGGSARGRVLHAEPGLFQLPDGLDHDQRGLRQAVRRPAPRTGNETDAA